MRNIRIRSSFGTIFIFVFIFSTVSLMAQVFTFGGRYATGTWAECITTGYFDDDEYLDIAVSHRDENLVLIYINDGSAGFSPSYSLEISRGSGLHSADFNSDGLDDLAQYDLGMIPPFDVWGTTVRLNNGDGTFNLVFQDSLGWGWEYMCVADFNNDDNSDIAIFNGLDSTEVWIYNGDGDGNFQQPALVKTFSTIDIQLVGAADLNNDGNIDIICENGNNTLALLNDGSSQFGDPVQTDEAMDNMVLADLNGDDFPDLVGTGNYACSRVPHFMLGNGDGTFGISVQAFMTAAVMLKSLVLSADFNSDGFGDIAFTSYDMESVVIGLNDGLMSFDNLESITEVDAGNIYMAAGDFDNDTDIDLAITGMQDTLTVALSLGAQHSNRILVPDDIPTIGEAVDYAWNLDEIIVEPGIYFENIDFGGKNLALMSSDFASKYLSGNLKLTYENSTSTIIDGGGTDRVFTFNNGEDDRSVVAGFTIQNGYAVSQGGGIYIAQSTNGVSSPIIMHNIIKDNHSDFVGGGIHIGSGTVVIKYNLIVGNSAASVGGGLYVIEGKEISNNTVYGNSAVNNGGGMFFNSGSPILCNNIFWGNSSTTGEQEIKYLTDPPEITYSDIMGGWTGTGNIDLDPRFVDPANDNFALLAESPCINTGDPASPLDPDGTIADMGAYYYQDPSDVDESGLQYTYGLLQNYPNPFNPTTKINYQIPELSFVTLKVFDVLGREVTILVNEELNAGKHEATFNASGISSGIYFYQIKANNYIQTKKMILMK